MFDYNIKRTAKRLWKWPLKTFLSLFTTAGVLWAASGFRWWDLLTRVHEGGLITFIQSIPFTIIIFVNALMCAKWFWEDKTERESQLLRFMRYSLKTVFVPATYIVIMILTDWVDNTSSVWCEFIKIKFASAGFATALAMPSLVYSVYSAMEANTAVLNSKKVIDDLVDAQITTSGATSDFGKCYRRAFLDPISVPTSWKIVRIRLLLSNPLYGFYSNCPKDDRTNFWKKFNNLSLDALEEPKELILFSPDAHYIYFARWLMSIAVNVEYKNNAGKRARKVGETQVQLLKQMKSLANQAAIPFEFEDSREDEKTLKLWLTHDCGYRIARYDYRIDKENIDSGTRSKVFVVLTHLSDLKRGPQEFVGTLLPITKSSHERIVGETNTSESIFEQFKQCPYTRKPDPVEESEFSSIRDDLLYMRTSHRQFTMMYLKSVCEALHKENVDNKPIELSESINEMINCVVFYFKNLPAAYRSVKIDPKHVEKLESEPRRAYQSNRIDDSILDKIKRVSNKAGRIDLIDAFIVPKHNEHFKSEYERFTRMLLARGGGVVVEDCDYCVAILYYLLSSGFTESVYAYNRQEST